MTSDIHILIAEDDPAIATGLGMNLELEGYRCETVTDGQKALERIAGSYPPHLVLLDIGLPKMDGLEILSKMRTRGLRIPVVVLSARLSESDKVLALRLGADDYVTKPFALAELLARIAAVLRRSIEVASVAQDFESFGEVKIDRQSRSVTRNGDVASLTHLEFELLLFFLDHPNEVLDRQLLLQNVWGTSGSKRTVDNFVGQLRSKLEVDPENPRYFVTIRGSGYRFCPAPESNDA